MNRKVPALLALLMLAHFGGLQAGSAVAEAPVTFIRNNGQFGEGPLFKAETGGATIFFETDRLTYVFAKKADIPVQTDKAHRSAGPGISTTFNTAKEYLAIKIKFLQANEKVDIHGLTPSGSMYNYFFGNDSDKWVTGLQGFSSIVYKNIYEGIDVRYYVRGQALKYDIIIQPGADPSVVKIQYLGVKELDLDPAGNLNISTAFGSIGEKAPYIYQIVDGVNHQIEGHFEVENANIFGFTIDGDYDIQYPLIIDPEYVYGTFLGGFGEDLSLNSAAESSGKIFLAGATQSVDFPVTPGVYDSTLSGTDVFVSCLDPAQSPSNQLTWSTFIGGDSTDHAYRIGVNSLEEVIIAGFTVSGNFPATTGSYDESFNGNWDAFIAKLNSTGSDLLYSTFMGGSADDWAANFGLDNSGNIIVGGFAKSPTFPTTPGTYQQYYGGGPTDAWIAKLSLDGNGSSDLIFSTFLGGSSGEGWAGDNIYYRSIMGLAITSLNDVVVAGLTASGDFPTVPGSYDMSFGGGSDGFISRIDSAGENLIYSSFLGSSESEGITSLSLDEFDAPICGGYTYSLGFPTTQGAFNRNHSGLYDDVFVTKFDLLATQLDYSTFVNSTEWASVWATDVGPDGDLYFCGFCGPGFDVTANAFDTTFNGGQDGFISRLRMAGQGVQDMIYSTYLGGNTGDLSVGLVLDSNELLSVSGITQSPDFPLAGQPFDTTYADGHDCYLSQFDFSASAIEDNPPVPCITALLPNYPNPFNASTAIRYELPSPSQVTIDIYDILGRQVTRLQDSIQPAGYHRAIWQADGFTSGIYFYKLQAGDYIETRKMILVK